MGEKRLTSSLFPRSAILSLLKMNGEKFVNFTKNKRIRGWGRRKEVIYVIRIR